MPRVLRMLSVVAVLSLLAVPALAQTPAQPAVEPLKIVPLPWLVVDARGGFASLGRDGTTASGLGVAAEDLPGRIRTAVLGVHVYPFRRGKVKIGFGVERLLGSGSAQKEDAEGVATGPKIHRRLDSLSGQVSANFGRGRGWSYITVGSGQVKFQSYRDGTGPDGLNDSTLNYGGGARWFTKTHVAFTVDVRFYLTRPAVPTVNTAARVRQRVLLLSAGISLK